MSTGFDSFNDQFEKAPARPRYSNEATAALPDGEYDVDVTAGLMKEGEHGPIVTILMVVLGGGAGSGWKIEKPYFLTKKGDDGSRVTDEKRMTELKTDLVTIGFDVENWSAAKGRPFSKQLAIACSVMKGLRLKVKKKQNGEYANLYINKRLHEVDTRPAKFGAGDMVEAPGQEAYGQSPMSAPPPPPPAAPPAPPAGEPASNPIPF